jgi:hypothetical protein
VERETVALVCEGEKTEGIYFNGLRRVYRLATATLHVVGLGSDPLTVVEHAVALQPGYDHTWAVFDIEASGPHAITHARLDQAFAKAERAGVRCAVSHPCFELWLILHYELRTAYLSNAAARAKARQLGCDYGDKGFDFSAVWPRCQDAIDNATKLDQRQRANVARVVDRNPWTTVHELVGQVLSIVDRQRS